MSSPAVPSGPPTQALAVKINPWYRAGAAALGLAGLGAGAVAVYTRHLEAGPAALLAVGLIFLLIAMSGRLPNRLRFGDYEAAWDAVQDFVETAADEVPAESRPEFVAALGELAVWVPQVARAGFDAVAYEDQVVGMINEAMRNLPSRARSTVGQFPSNQERVFPSQGGYFDLRLEAPDRVVGVEIRSSTKMLSPDSIEHLARQISYETNRRDKRVVALLVTRTPLRSDVLLMLSDRRDIYHVVVAGRQDFGKLETAIRNALGRGLQGT